MLPNNVTGIKRLVTQSVRLLITMLELSEFLLTQATNIKYRIILSRGLDLDSN